MTSKTPQLNKTTASLKNIFPALSALIVFTPLMVSAEIIINDNTDAPQTFSSDNTYIIPEDVSITNSTDMPTVTVKGQVIDGVTNYGKVSGVGDGMLIATGSQKVIINNQQSGLIESTGATGIYVENMGGDINNAGKILGAEYGIKIHEDSSNVNIANTGTIQGKTAFTSGASVIIDNDGMLKGGTDNGILLDASGKSNLNNRGQIEADVNGVVVTGNHRLNIGNNGLIKGSESAITFESTQANTLTLGQGSVLDGNVISTNSTTNTLALLDSGSEDSNFRGLNAGDGFASLSMDGTDWSLTGNIDIIGAGDSIKINSGKLTLAGIVKNDAGNTLISEAGHLQLGNGDQTGFLTGTLTNNGTFTFNQGSDSVFAGDITGSGNVKKIDANLLTLTGNNSYTGNTLLNSGTTLIAEGATLGTSGNTATVTVGNGATFASAGTVNNNINILNGGTLASWNAISGNSVTPSTANTINGNVTNSGTLQVNGLNDHVGNRFVINGNYTGTSGSQILMNSVLGEDDSATDHLTITGDSAGQSGIRISNIGGLGAQTVNGMQVVKVSGNSDAAFSLSRPVVAGAWEYSLNKHTDGNWYLESANTSPSPAPEPTPDPTPDPTPAPQPAPEPDDNGNNTNPDDGGYTPPAPSNMAPEVGAYMGNYLAAQGMFLHKRDDRDQLTLRDGEDLNTWMYVKGRYHDNDVAGGKVNYDTTQYVMQVGSDFISK